MLDQALAPSTWQGMRSVYRRFRLFWHGLSTLSPHLPPAVVVALFVVRLLKAGEIIYSSALTYANSLVSALRRDGIDLRGNIVVTDLRRALRRLGAGRPTKQAWPADAETVKQCVLQTACRRTAMVVLLAWRAGARVGDVVRLRTRDVEFMPGGVKLTFWESKSDPFHKGTFTSASLSEGETEELRAYMQAWGSDEKPLAVSTARVTAALKAVDPRLSCHSLRRGALTLLLRRGTDLEGIKALSRHATTTALLRYLPCAELASVEEAGRVSTLLRF
eukprot:TRINITY_DN10282_c0_g2_i2.p2 TRINITY_DN10282_c0_g2~~TRINITY_DN10282_c0_g2_i2.p2  ORF type:complete len:276 (+),score=35.30 TRINITY_DN10282_c0_g2_i2:223-1050(+)